MSGARRLPDEAVRALQEALVRSVLLRQPLPGTDQPVLFPDLAFLEQAPELLFAAENVPVPLDVSDLGRPVVTLPEDDIRASAGERGDLAYVHFTPVEEEGGRVLVGMEARLAPGRPGLQPMGLGGVRAWFHETGTGWEAAEPPVVYAI